jgi:predicted HicB family RNase H-like nuclease
MQSPIFEFLRYLRYRPDPARPSYYLKNVTEEWVDQLNWRQVAWWYRDDGGKQGRQMVFATHSFTRVECDLLSGWLTQNGVPAETREVRKGAHFYWNVRVLTEASETLVEKLRPFMHPTMLYKLPEFDPAPLCAICGSPVLAQVCGAKSSKLCSEACKKEVLRRKYAKFCSEPGAPKAKYQASKMKLLQDPETHKARNRKSAAIARDLRLNPAWVQRTNELKKDSRKLRKASGNPERPCQTHTCMYCDQVFSNSPSHNMSKRSAFISCQVLACMELRASDVLKRERAMDRIRRSRPKDSQRTK